MNGKNDHISPGYVSNVHLMSHLPLQQHTVTIIPENKLMSQICVGKREKQFRRWLGKQYHFI
jgi:hypothetical protein